MQACGACLVASCHSESDIASVLLALKFKYLAVLVELFVVCGADCARLRDGVTRHVCERGLLCAAFGDERDERVSWEAVNVFEIAEVFVHLI